MSSVFQEKLLKNFCQLFQIVFALMMMMLVATEAYFIHPDNSMHDPGMAAPGDEGTYVSRLDI